MTRPDWDTYFMTLAVAAATRATCDRAHVGAVAVKGHQVVGTGYNGALPGMEHCTAIGCDIEDGHCVRVIHAETNLVAHAARRGVSLEGATIFCTHFPCYPCAKVLFSAGVKKVVYQDAYRPDTRVVHAALHQLVEVVQVEGKQVEEWATVHR